MTRPPADGWDAATFAALLYVDAEAAAGIAVEVGDAWPDGIADGITALIGVDWFDEMLAGRPEAALSLCAGLPVGDARRRRAASAVLDAINDGIYGADETAIVGVLTRFAFELADGVTLDLPAETPVWWTEQDGDRVWSHWMEVWPPDEEDWGITVLSPADGECLCGNWGGAVAIGDDLMLVQPLGSGQPRVMTKGDLDRFVIRLLMDTPIGTHGEACGTFVRTVTGVEPTTVSLRSMLHTDECHHFHFMADPPGPSGD